MNIHRIVTATAGVVSLSLGWCTFAQTSPQPGASAETPASQEPAPSPGEAQLPATPADGAVIIQIQKRLAAEGYDSGTADGVWGPQTEAAVRNFQQDQDLDATGQLDQETIAILLVSAESGSMEAAGGQGAADQQTQGGSSAGESSAAQSPSHDAQQQPQERR